MPWCLSPRAPTLQHDQHGLLQVHANCGELWKELEAPKQRKQPHVRHRHSHLGSDWGVFVSAERCASAGLGAAPIPPSPLETRFSISQNLFDFVLCQNSCKEQYFHVLCSKRDAGRRTDFRDKKSTDFSGEIFRERNFGSSITAPTNLFPLIGCGVDSFSPN